MNNKFLVLGLVGALSLPAVASSKKQATEKAGAHGSSMLTVDTAASVVNWKGAKVAGPHNGKIKIKEGSLVVEGGALKSGVVTIDMNSMTNEDLTDAKYNEKLMGHLKSDDFFAVEKNPVSVFKINSVKVVNAAENTYELAGDLTIKGKTNPLTVPAKIEMKDGVLTATATAKVDRLKYDIRYGSGKFFQNLGDKMIYDEFELNVALSAKAASKK